MTSARSDESVAICTKCGNEQAATGLAVRCVHCGEPLPQRQAAEARPLQAREHRSDNAGFGSDRFFGRLTVALQWIFAAWVVMAGIGIAFRAMERSLLNRAIDNRFSVSPAEALASDHRVDTLGYVMFGAFVVTAVVFIVWFHRAYRSTRTLGGEMRYSDGWAIGAWFIPIAWLWIPKKLANDIWWGTEPPEYRSWRERSALLASWWSALILAVATARFIGATDIDSLEDGLNSNLAASVFLGFVLLAAVLAFFVVRQIGQRLAARRAAVGAVIAGEAPPPVSQTNADVFADPGLVITTGSRRQPWRLIGATVAIVALAVGTVVAIAGTSSSAAHKSTASKPVTTAPPVVPAAAPADFDRHESHDDGFAISVPNSWTTIDLTAPDIDKTLDQLRLTNPEITDYLDQQKQSAVSFVALDASSESAVFPAQFNVVQIPSEGESLNEDARQLAQALEDNFDLAGSIDRKRVDLPAGSAEVLSFKLRDTAPGGESAVWYKSMYVLVAADSVYAVTLSVNDELAPATTPTFEAIIRSLELTG